MNNLLNEIKQLAQQGLENTIIAKDDKNKDIFLNIMLKSELALNKIPMKNIYLSFLIHNSRLYVLNFLSIFYKCYTSLFQLSSSFQILLSPLAHSMQYHSL